MKRIIPILITIIGAFGLFLAHTAPAEAQVALTAACHIPSQLSSEACNGPAFVDPEISDSIADPIPYGRLADNANVYAEPSRSAPVVRNVGDGYLFASIFSWSREADGAVWYMINFGEYIHESDITPVDASPFHGVEAAWQPERPFGWIVQNVQPSLAPDTDPHQAFAELPRLTFFQVYDAVIGEDDWLWYNIGGGQWIRQTYVSLVDVNPRPEGVGPTDFWVEVDLYEQTFAAYEGDTMVFATLISSGLNRWPTREGTFQVWDRWEKYKMSGAEGQVDYYHLEDIPYIMYFDERNGIALHGTYWHDRFGYKHSHGCVNMSVADAEWTFEWSEGSPNDLFVWVHTSDPNHYFDKFDTVTTSN